MAEEKKIKVTVLHCGTISPVPYMAYKNDRGLKRVTLPVSCYLIEHPVHGKILVDTGLSPERCSALPKHLRALFRPSIETGQTALEQLSAMGIAPEDLDMVLLTHNDFDHTGAIADFAGMAKKIVEPEAEWFWSPRLVYKSRQDWDGYIRFDKLIERRFYYGSAQGPTGRAFDLFGDDSILCVFTPGHTDGQMAVMINKAPSGRFQNAGAGIYGNEFLVLGADAGFSQRNLDDLVPPGYGFNAQNMIKSLKWLRTLRDDQKCLGVLFSHEKDTQKTYVF